MGAGPAGIYAAEALSQQTDIAVEVAVIDRLPVPFGLVRYGVAPDHHSIRSIRNTLERTLDKPSVRFYGDVAIGSDLGLAELEVATGDLRFPASSCRGASPRPSWWRGIAAIPTSIPIPTCSAPEIISWRPRSTN